MNFFLHGFADELTKHASVMGNMAAKAVPDAITKAKANRPYKTVDKIPADAQRAPAGSPTAAQFKQKVGNWNRLKAFAEKDLKPGEGIQMPPHPGARTPPKKVAPRLAGTKR